MKGALTSGSSGCGVPLHVCALGASHASTLSRPRVAGWLLLSKFGLAPIPAHPRTLLRIEGEKGKRLEAKARCCIWDMAVRKCGTNLFLTEKLFRGAGRERDVEGC